MKKNDNTLLILAFLAVPFLMQGSEQSDPASVDVPTNYDLAVAKARLTYRHDTPEEVPDAPLIVDFDITKKEPLPANLYEETSSETEYTYGEKVTEYRNSGGRPWSASSNGRKMGLQQLREHVAEHVGEDPYIFSEWGYSDLEYLHGWAHEKEKGAVSEGGALLMKNKAIRTAPTQYCPTGTCPNTTTRWRLFR